MKRLLVVGLLVVGALSVALTAGAGEDVRGYWRMNEASGQSIEDSSGNGHTAAGTNIAWAPGINSASVNMKTGGYLEIENSAGLNPSDAITIETWIRPWKPNFGDTPRFVNKEGAYILSFVPGGKAGIKLWIDGKEQLLSSKRTGWPDGKWVHLAATYDGSKIKLYINGKKDSELAVSGKIDESKANVYIGSEMGTHVFWNPMDEVRISGAAHSPEEIHAAYMANRYEVDRSNARFTSFFHKGEKREPKAVIPGYIWIDAEDFMEYGGWWMDTQFVPQMGSPYLLAAGTGEPVADAVTIVDVADAGTYKLWVRNRNWIKDHNPGTFKVSVNGRESETVFGTEPVEEWVWQDGGTFELAAGPVELALQDLTGYYGRCDALVLTKDMHYVPPFKLAGVKGERRRLTGAGAGEVTVGDYDVVVVGAGVAGINAAIASSRSGARTALIQNRPMIGGNNSPELGVPVLGPADFGQKNAREGGLNEEIGRLRSYNFMLKWSQGAEVVAAAETNLTIVLNTHVYDVERTEGNRITAVRAFDMIEGHLTRYTGTQFIDCTGDAWVGYYAGAELMRGREPRWMFNESNAPEEGDILTMSGSIFQAHTLGYNSVDTGNPCPFDAPEWVWDLSYNTTNLQARKLYENTYKSGTWWHENRNDMDDLWDPEAARDGLIRVSLSYWNWIKIHSDKKELAANRKLLPIPVNNAKRETVRLVGDHILTQDEVLSAAPFPDRIGNGGWGLDIHHPDGIFSTEGPFDFNTHTPLHNLPFRMIYSKNVPNLMMAGRHVSCSRVTLGTVRVQATTGVMGQAAGTAAAMCVRYGVDPRGIYQSHIPELQQQLLKDDQYIIDMKNEDPADMARSAKISASSAMDSHEPENVISGVARIVGDETHMWASDPGQSLPQWVELKLDGKKKINAVYLTFDTDVNVAKRSTWEYKDSERMVPQCAKNYQVQVFDGRDWKTVVDVQGNYQRRRIHCFPVVEGTKIKVVISETNGDPSARIYEVRAYNE